VYQSRVNIDENSLIKAVNFLSTIVRHK